MSTENVLFDFSGRVIVDDKEGLVPPPPVEDHEIFWDHTGSDSPVNPKGKKMVEAYRSDDNSLKIKVPDPGDPTNQISVPLEFVRIPKSAIEKLNDNGADEYILFFAASAATYSTGDEKVFTLILAGAKEVNGTKKIMTSPVFNKFDPCPKNCLEYDNPTLRPTGAVDCSDGRNPGLCVLSAI